MQLTRQMILRLIEMRELFAIWSISVHYLDAELICRLVARPYSRLLMTQVCQEHNVTQCIPIDKKHNIELESAMHTECVSICVEHACSSARMLETGERNAKSSVYLSPVMQCTPHLNLLPDTRWYETNSEHTLVSISRADNHMVCCIWTCCVAGCFTVPFATLSFSHMNMSCINNMTMSIKLLTLYWNESSVPDGLIWLHFISRSCTWSFPPQMHE